MKIYCYNPKIDYEYSYYITKINKESEDYIFHTDVFLWDFPVSFVNNSCCLEHTSHRKLSKYTDRQKEILKQKFIKNH